MWDMQVSRAAFFFLLIALLPGWAWAQMYLWEDEQGTVHYTNELQSVPEPYRSRARFVPASPMAPPAVAPAQGNARINGGGPVTLILDTGADRTLLTPMALWRLGISTDNAPPAEIKGATGTARAALVQVLSVEVGEARAGPLLIIAHDADLKQAEGLLGRDFLERFTVTIDASERVVTLVPK